MCMHRSPTVCYCTVTYPTLPISAFHIIWFYIYGVFPSVVQNLLRDTGRKTTDNNLSEATYRILCKERSLTEVAREISPTNPKGPVLYCSDSGKASPVPDHSTVLPDYSSSFFRFTGLSIIYFIPSFFFFLTAQITVQSCVTPTVRVALHMEGIRYWVCGLVSVLLWFFVWFLVVLLLFFFK